MKKEHSPEGNLFRFRQVKWGNPRHRFNALRNKVPVAVDEDPPAGPLFWVLVVVLTAGAFAGVILYCVQHSMA